MFDQILALVKQHMNNNSTEPLPIPADKREAVNNEIATHITSGLQSYASQGEAGDFLGKVKNAIGSGSAVTHAIEGGLVGALGKKFGLSPIITGAIAASLPSILQKFVDKANDSADNHITEESVNQSLSGKENTLSSLLH